jgi:hypothetical protein
MAAYPLDGRVYLAQLRPDLSVHQPSDHMHITLLSMRQRTPLLIQSHHGGGECGCATCKHHLHHMHAAEEEVRDIPDWINVMQPDVPPGDLRRRQEEP